MKKARQAFPIYVPGCVQEAAKEAADSSTKIHHQPLREMIQSPSSSESTVSI